MKISIASRGVDMLLQQMRAGDREAAAELMKRYGSRMRRRIRGKLDPAMRRLFDSQEILATIGRRLDLYVKDQKLTSVDEPEFCALLWKMIEHAVLDKSKVYRRLEQAEDEEGVIAQDLLRRLRLAERAKTHGALIELHSLLDALNDEIDRKILKLWLTGDPVEVIAHVLGLSSSAVYKRWTGVRARLRRHLTAEARVSCHSRT